MDVLLAFSVKFPVTVFDYLHGYTTGMWNTLFLHLRHWTNTLNIYVSAYLCKEVLLLPRFNFTKPHSYWAHTVLWATGSTVWVPKRSHRVEKQTLDVKLQNVWRHQEPFANQSHFTLATTSFITANVIDNSQCVCMASCGVIWATVTGKVNHRHSLKVQQSVNLQFLINSC